MGMINTKVKVVAALWKPKRGGRVGKIPVVSVSVSNILALNAGREFVTFVIMLYMFNIYET